MTRSQLSRDPRSKSMASYDPEFENAPKFSPEYDDSQPQATRLFLLWVCDRQRSYRADDHCLGGPCLLRDALVFPLRGGMDLDGAHGAAQGSASEEERKGVRERVDAFKRALDAGTAIDPLVLTSDDLNALIEDNPKFRGRLFTPGRGRQAQGSDQLTLGGPGHSDVQGTLPEWRGRAQSLAQRGHSCGDLGNAGGQRQASARAVSCRDAQAKPGQGRL